MILLILVSFPCFSNGNDNDKKQKILDQVKFLTTTLGVEYSYEAIKKRYADSGDYLVLAKVTTHPEIASELIMVAAGANTDFLYISSRSNREVFCTVSDNNLGVRFPDDSEYALSNITDVDEGVHPYYTVIEKRKNGRTKLFAYNGFSNEYDGLTDTTFRENIYKLRSRLFKSMFDNCPNYFIGHLE